MSNDEAGPLPEDRPARLHRVEGTACPDGSVSMLADTPRCASPGWPAAVHEAVEYEAGCAYSAGWHAALVSVAAGHAELDAVSRCIGQWTNGQRVAARLARAERGAALVADQLGRPPGYRYDGGSVDWQTGQPAIQGRSA